MRASKKALFIPLMICLLYSCSSGGSNETSTVVAVSHVDSITRQAPDTLRASMDTSALKKDTAFAGEARDGSRR